MCNTKVSKIVGGYEVLPNSIPWQVALVRRGSNSFECGGVLISDRHVLTAHHCESSVDVVIGAHRIKHENVTTGIRHGVCRFANHPYHNENTLDNDFRILHLKTPVKLGSLAKVACLPPSRFDDKFLAGKMLTASGWGRLKENGSVSDTLHAVGVIGMDNDLCQRRYARFNSDLYTRNFEERFWKKYTPWYITDSVLCAGRSRREMDSCEGDSGGKCGFSWNKSITIL